MKILVATHNKGKIKEISEMLENENIKVISLSDLNDQDEVVENADNFRGNAFLKANYYYQKYNLPCLADDSGLVVDSLNGMPGVYSARYASKDASDFENNLKLLDKLKDCLSRDAYFITVLCFIDQNGQASYFTGRIDGKISNELKGDHGFGYDPLFIPNGYNHTFAELDQKVKNKISHRSKALQAFKENISEEQDNE